MLEVFIVKLQMIFFIKKNCLSSKDSDTHYSFSAFLQYDNPSDQIEKLIDVVVQVQPHFIVFGTHHYVQMSESKYLAAKDPELFSSVKIICPMGAAVPTICETRLRERFTKIQVQ